MKKIILYLLMVILTLGCSAIKSYTSIDKIETMENNDSKSKSKKQSKDNSINNILDNSDPFYPIAKSIEGMQKEIDDLRSRVIEYESKISTPRMNPDYLNLIKLPELKHEITMKNGNIFRGIIISQNGDQIILDTHLGQINIDKGNINITEEISPSAPNIEFDGDAIEEIYGDKRVYKGSVKNDGAKRADFVRIIYMLWGENTSLISIDSSFVQGQLTSYNSGIITDCSINPGQYANFEVSIPISEEDNVEYFTRTIEFETTE